MKRNRYPAGWNQARVRRVLEHYEQQAEDEAVAEDEAAFHMRSQAVVLVPKRLVPEVTRFIEGRRRARRPRRPGRARAPSGPRRNNVAQTHRAAKSTGPRSNSQGRRQMAQRTMVQRMAASATSCSRWPDREPAPASR